MRISDFRDGSAFDDFIKYLFAAAYGDDFVVVNDSSGDKGVDGYIRSEKLLFAAYCPALYDDRSDARYRDKIREDLKKAKVLKDSGRYQINQWTFVTPQDLNEEANHFLAEEVKAVLGVVGVSWGEKRLDLLFQNTPSAHARYQDLRAPNIEQQIRELRDGLDNGDEMTVFGSDPIDQISGAEPVSRFCDDEIDAQDIPIFTRDVHSESARIRHEAYKIARKHRNCRRWDAFSKQLDARWNAAGVAAPSPGERAEIVHLWATGHEYCRAQDLATFWTTQPEGVVAPLSGSIHGFLMDAMYADPDKAFAVVAPLLEKKALPEFPPNVAPDLLSLMKKMLEHGGPKPSRESIQRAELLFPKLAPHQKQFHMIGEIERLLSPFAP